MRRRLLAVLAGLFVSLALAVAGAGNASATAAPTPENPNSTGISVLTAPNPLPPDAPFNSSDLLTYYGTAGPSFNAYTDGMNFVESTIAYGGTGTANTFFNLPKTVIAVAAALAGWVFNPGSLLERLTGPTNEVAKDLSEQLTAPWLPIIILIVTAMLTWAAIKGKVGLTLTRILYVIIGLGFVGLGLSAPASLAGKFTGLIGDTTAAILAPTPPGMDAATARATLGTRMLGPIWKAAVYDPWLTGTLGSSTSNTAQTYGPALFQASALTWREAAPSAPAAAPDNAAGMPQTLPGNTTDPKTLQDVTGTPNVARTPERKVTPDPLRPIMAAKQADYDGLARDINISDASAYEALQGKSGYGFALVMSYLVTACTLPILLLALLAVLAAYLVLFMVAAASPVIGPAVILYPQVLGKVGKMVAGFLIDAVLAAVAARIVIAFVGLVLAVDPWFGAILSAVGSWLAWRFMSKHRAVFQYSAKAGGFGMKLAEMGVAAAAGGAGWTVGQWKATRDANQAAAEKDAAERKTAEDQGPAQVEALPPLEATGSRQGDSGQQHVHPAGQGNPWFDAAAQMPEGVASMDEYRSKRGTTATTTGRHGTVVHVGHPDNVAETDAPQQQWEPAPAATADRAATPSDPMAEHPHQDAPEAYSYAERARPAAERVIFNPATGRNEQVTVPEAEDGPPSVVIARADTPTEESA